MAARSPARGWGMQPLSGSRSFSSGGRANTATCLRSRRQERKSSLPAAPAAGKTRAGARPAPGALLPATNAGARAHTKPLQFYLLPSLASLSSPQSSRPCRQPELREAV